MKEKLLTFLSRHKFAIASVTAALLVTILLLTLGFWRTILVAVLLGIGLLIGVGLDRGKSFVEIVYGWSQTWRRIGTVIRNWIKN